MSYNTNVAAADAAQAAARLPDTLKKLAASHAAATAGFRVEFMSPEQALDAVRTWREAQDHLREGAVYAAGLAIMAGASSSSAHLRLGMGRLELQRTLYRFSLFHETLVRQPVPKPKRVTR